MLNHPIDLPDGVYFGLDENVYHAQPRFSASGVKAMKESPDDYWYASWMNKDRKSYSNPAMCFGSALHKYILEGSTAFDASYYIPPTQDDFEDLLVTSNDIKAKLKELGEKVSGTKDEMITRLLNAGYQGTIWDHIIEACAEENEGKQKIDFDTYAKIRECAAMVEHHQQISKVFANGSPEVSILWTGLNCVPMKARLDNLSPGYVADLKSFSNKTNKNVDNAIYREFAYMRHHIQTAVYWEAVKAAKELPTFGYVPDWWTAFLKNENPMGFIYVYIKTTGAPVVRGKLIPNMAMSAQVGHNEYVVACETYAKFWDIFGEERWIEQRQIEELDDDGIPPWSYE